MHLKEQDKTHISTLDLHVPKTHIYINSKWANDPWWNDKIHKSIFNREYKKVAFTISTENWFIYKFNKNLSVNKIRRVKKEYYKGKFDD